MRHLQSLPPSNDHDLILKLIEFLIKELPPIGRQFRVGAYMAALILVIGVMTDLLADPVLYAAIVLIANLIAGVLGQGVDEVQKHAIQRERTRAQNMDETS